MITAPAFCGAISRNFSATLCGVTDSPSLLYPGPATLPHFALRWLYENKTPGTMPRDPSCRWRQTLRPRRRSSPTYACIWMTTAQSASSIFPLAPMCQIRPTGECQSATMPPPTHISELRLPSTPFPSWSGHSFGKCHSSGEFTLWLPAEPPARISGRDVVADERNSPYER